MFLNVDTNMPTFVGWLHLHTREEVAINVFFSKSEHVIFTLFLWENYSIALLKPPFSEIPFNYVCHNDNIMISDRNSFI